MVLVRPADNSGELKAQLEQTQEMLKKTQEELSESEVKKETAQEQLDEMTEQILKHESSVQSKGLELIIAVDVSGSMENALGHLVETIRTLTTVLPRITSELRIGVVAYVDAYSGGLEVFNTRQIFAEHKDNGSSLRDINNFMLKLKAVSGYARIDKAINYSMSITSSLSEFDGYQAIMIIGDVGPYETEIGDWASVEQHERQIERKIFEDINQWANSSDNRSFISLYSGASPDNNSPEKLKSSYNFFRDAAHSAGQPENFTQNAAKMLPTLLDSIIKDNNE